MDRTQAPSCAGHTLYYPPDAFARVDEKDDALFYRTDRFVQHVDSRALQTIERVIGTLCVESKPAILDLMASFDSHLPARLHPREMVGLGLNVRELQKNSRLTEVVVHDLNRERELPFEDDRFDVVLNTLSVDYLVDPFTVFSEVYRILKPGGLFLVIFSNRMFKTKVVKIWQEASATERQLLVEDWFASVPGFSKRSSFASIGKPRPDHDKYAELGIPSDPVYAIWSEKSDAVGTRSLRPEVAPETVEEPDPEELARRKAVIRHTLKCPYCEKSLTKWQVPQTPYTEWPNEFMYVCFNNVCPYVVGGWDVMHQQGNHGFTYRLVYNPDTDTCMAAPASSLKAYAETDIAPRG